VQIVFRSIENATYIQIEVIKKSLLPVNAAARVLLSNEHVCSEHET